MMKEEAEHLVFYEKGGRQMKKSLIAMVCIVVGALLFQQALFIRCATLAQETSSQEDPNLNYLSCKINLDGTEDWTEIDYDQPIAMHSGEIYNIQVQYLNQAGVHVPEFAMTIGMPSEIFEYQMGSLRIWNTVHPSGTSYPDNVRNMRATTTLVLDELGNYAPEANVFVQFRVRVQPSSKLRPSNTSSIRALLESEGQFITSEDVLTAMRINDTMGSRLRLAMTVALVGTIAMIIAKILKKPIAIVANQPANVQ